MKFLLKNKLLLLILFLGLFLRFYNLSSVPQGFFSDEAAVGYNAYSIIKTGRDEFGKFMPLFFRSFGEGKLPLYVYQAVPFIFLLGPTKLAVRFPGALFGSLTILALYWFLIEILPFSKVSKKHYQPIALASALSLAIMPWHIHFSRGVFGQESIFWVILGSALIVNGLKRSNKLFTTLGFISFSCSLLIYHSPKVILPLWAPILLLTINSQLKKSLSWLTKQVAPGVLLLIAVWGIMTFNPLGMARSKGVSVFSEQSGVSAKLFEIQSLQFNLNNSVLISNLFNNKFESFGRDIIGRYLSHFNPDLLFISGDTIRPRYRVPNQPQVFIIFLPFLILGTYLCFSKKLYLPFIFLLLAPLPASMSFETPSTVRALFETPALATLIGIGLIGAINIIKSKSNLIKNSFITILFSIFIYQFASYANSYFIINNIFKPYEWQYPYQPLAAVLKDLEPNYDRIIVNDSAGPPYIFLLFFYKYDPAKYQLEVNQHIGDSDIFGFIHINGFSKYEFNKTDCTYDQYAKNTLFVCRGLGPEIDKSHLIQSIYYADGKIAFSIFDPEHEN
jgi:4-amino-4-deoxy-L-arabinose transferase-like glycosyltransferase